MRFLKLFSYFSFFLFILSSCGDDEEQLEPFQAIVTVDSVYSPGTTVTLDASSAQGISGASVEWRVNGLPSGMQENDLISAGFESNAVTTSFTVERIGTYNFLLQITKNGRISTANAGFTVSGILEINSISDLNGEGFKNLDGLSDEVVGDYLINTVLTIASGENIPVEPGTTLMFGPQGGLDIQGTLRSGDNMGNTGDIYLTAQQDGFKGVQLAGSIDAPVLKIIKGGNASFTSDPNDAANLYISSGSFGVTNFYSSSSIGYGLILSKDFFGLSSNTTLNFESNINTARMDNGSFINSFITANDQVGARLELFYKDLIRQNIQKSLGGLTVIILDSLVIQPSSSGSNSQILDGTILLEKEAYINITEYSFYFRDLVIGSVDEGFLNRGSGIATTAGIIMENCTIENLGLSPLPAAPEQAAVFIRSAGLSSVFRNCVFDNHLGTAIYANSGISILENCTFTNNSLAYIQMPFQTAGNIMADNTFDDQTPGTVAVKLFETSGGTTNFSTTWNDLGGNNFYQVDADMYWNDWTLMPGVKIEMRTDKSIRIGNSFDAIGTSNQPITIKGAIASAGYWKGVKIEGNANMDYVNISDAGSNSGRSFFNSPFGAGLVVESISARNVNVTNSSIISNAEYGVVIKQGAGDFAIDSVSSNNTLQGNLGGYYDDN